LAASLESLGRVDKIILLVFVPNVEPARFPHAPRLGGRECHVSALDEEAAANATMREDR